MPLRIFAEPIVFLPLARAPGQSSGSWHAHPQKKSSTGGGPQNRRMTRQLAIVLARLPARPAHLRRSGSTAARKCLPVYDGKDRDDYGAIARTTRPHPPATRPISAWVAMSHMSGTRLMSPAETTAEVTSSRRDRLICGYSSLTATDRLFALFSKGLERRPG